MTQAALTAAVNTLLASGQPITAVIHRSAAAQIISEMYTAQSRGDVLNGVQVAVSKVAGDEIFILRGGQAYKMASSLVGGLDGGTA